MYFHKYAEANAAVTNCMSKFSMFVTTNTTLKLVTSEIIEHCDFVDPQGYSWR